MDAFIYIELGLLPDYAYHKPVLAEVKKRLSSVEFLDLDSFSEEFLMVQANQVAEAADSCAVYFKSYDAEAPLGATLSLIEMLIRRKQTTLIVLQGEHNRLERLLNNRGNLKFLKNPEDFRMFACLDHFFTEVKK